MPVHKQIAIAIFGVVLLATIVIVMLYVSGPWGSPSPKHTKYVELVNSTFVTHSIDIDGKTLAVPSLSSDKVVIKTGSVIRDVDTGNTLTVPPTGGISTIYILDSGFATNMTAVEVNLVNDSSFPAMFMDAAYTAPTRMARETVGPDGGVSQYKYVVAKGNEWQVVNPERNDVVLASLSAGLVDTNARSLVFDGDTLKLV